jgi:DNA polymerase V
VEVYSIDECFADLTGVPGDLVRIGREMRARVLRCTGIPVGVGIGTSKTLSKLANHGAKKWQAQTGGVLDVRDPARRDRLLKACDVSDVWGVGKGDSPARRGTCGTGLGGAAGADEPELYYEAC